MARTDLLSIIRSLDTVFTGIGICHTGYVDCLIARLGLSDSQYNLLTPWCRVLLEKLTGLKLVKKFPAFHGTQRCITALTSARLLSLYPGPAQCSPYTHIPPPGDPFQYYPPIYA